ncbi:MAG: hypothetical protein EB027_05615, partial [Actinobacteria bacterium]|nr:hypothetical protein [Actinomycetota bacterium]
MGVVSGAVAFGLLGHVYDDEVDAASQQAQAAIDQVLLHPLIRRPSTLTEEFVSRLRLTEAHASAALAGAEIPFAAFASSLMGDSPLSIRLRAAVSVEQASRESADVLSMSPPRALGAWHVRASAGAGLPEELRGRPVTSAQGSVVRDELNTGLVRLLVEDCVPAITGVVTNPQIPAVTAAGTVHALQPGRVVRC